MDIYNNSSIFFWYKPDVNMKNRYPASVIEPLKSSFIPSSEVSDMFVLSLKGLRVQID